MTEQKLREKIAELEHTQWESWARIRNPEHPLLNVPFNELTEAQKDQDREWADRVLALIVEAGWLLIDPATPKIPYDVELGEDQILIVMPGEFGTPKAAEILHEWATANGYVKLAEDQTLPEIPSFAYDNEENRELLQRGAINYSKMFTGWRKVEQEVKDES